MVEPLNLSSGSSKELRDAIFWYEQHQQALGGRFERAVESTLARIAEHPFAYSSLRGRWRRALIPRFPYVIIYRPMADAIYVLSCFHTRRDPKEWRRRI